MISVATTSVMRSVPGGKRGVLVAKGYADLAGDGAGRRVRDVLALVVVDGPGQGGDGHDQAGQRNRVQIPVRALLGVAGGQCSLDLGAQVRAKFRGEDRGGGPGRVCGWVD